MKGSEILGRGRKRTKAKLKSFVFPAVRSSLWQWVQRYPPERRVVRILKVARTIADLAAEDNLSPKYLSEACSIEGW